MTDTESLVQLEGRRAGIVLSDERLADLALFVDTLGRWGKKMNLTANPSPEEVIGRQLPDAFYMYRHLQEQQDLQFKVYADVGSGAGLPGLVFALLVPEIKSTLVEANHKKCSFLRTVVHTLNRKDIAISNHRIEHSSIFEVDFVSSRATWAPERWLERAAAVVRHQGFAVVFSNEAAAIGDPVHGFSFHSRISYSLSDGAKRVQTYFQLTDGLC